jgi:hypothetical protein
MMTIQVRRPDVAEDIRTLSALTGTSITDAIAMAVRNQLAIERARADVRLAKRKEDSARLLAQIRNLPVLGPDLNDSDLYDADGLPK